MSGTSISTPSAAAAGHCAIAARALTSRDSAAFYALCARYPMRTLTSRLNVEAHGFQGPVVRSWGVFNEAQDELAGLLLRYGNTAVAVDGDGGCAPAFANMIDEQRNIVGVRGSLEVVGGIQALLRRYTPTDWEDSYFLTLHRPPAIDGAAFDNARRASLRDIDLLTELYSGAGAMYRSRSNVASKLAQSRVFVVDEPPVGRRAKRIASCALLNVEGADAGLIGGVYTLPSARGKGYAGACTALLAADLQRDGKTPCLFYENPIAGKVYRRLGFDDASRWAVLILAPTHASRPGR
jgi:uncharacterized protein